MNNKPATVAATFETYNDGSGCFARHTLRNRITIYLTFANPERGTRWHIVENSNGTRGHGGKQGLGYGRAEGIALSEIKKAVADFDAKIAALGPEYLAAARALYCPATGPATVAA